MNKSNPPPEENKPQLHPTVKTINTLVGYAMLEYADSIQGKWVNKEKLSQEELTLYISTLHSRFIQEIENNSIFRKTLLHSARLIFKTIAKE